MQDFLSRSKSRDIQPYTTKGAVNIITNRTLYETFIKTLKIDKQEKPFFLCHYEEIFLDDKGTYRDDVSKLNHYLKDLLREFEDWKTKHRVIL
jgi:hypothetical protein